MSDDINWKDADEFCKGAFGPFVSNVSQYTEIVAELMQRATDRERKRSADEIERLREETRIFVLPGGERGVICGGRFDGWLCWHHPDGQFVTLEKLKAEAPRSLFNEPQKGLMP